MLKTQSEYLEFQLNEAIIKKKQLWHENSPKTVKKQGKFILKIRSQFLQTAEVLNSI